MRQLGSEDHVAYRREVAISGDPRRAIELVQTALVQSGYRITDASDDCVTGAHAGGFVKTQSGQAIHGASPITATVQVGVLRVSAGYGGVERTRRFLVRLLVGLGIGLGGGLGLLFLLIFEERWPALLGLALGAGVPLLQIPVHTSWTLRIMRSRTALALDTLVENIRTLTRR